MQTKAKLSPCMPPEAGLGAGAETEEEEMKPIYVPKGRAGEYGDYAINIYTGCPHRCYYCFAPGVLRREREQFHACVESRPNIVEEVKRQLDREKITSKLIHLCFTCDPYPTGYDTTPTREIIKAIKDAGNHVQILTKGSGVRDFDLLDSEDWYGVTLSCWSDMSKVAEPGAALPGVRLATAAAAKERGIKTWASFEPVLDAKTVLWLLSDGKSFFDKVKIGKLNYHPSDIDWAVFGKEAEAICQSRGLDYYIKDDLRKEMEAAK